MSTSSKIWIGLGTFSILYSVFGLIALQPNSTTEIVWSAFNIVVWTLIICKEYAER